MCLFLPLSSSIAGLVNNGEAMIFIPHFQNVIKKQLLQKSCHGFTLPDPTVCFSLAYALLPPHKSTHHAVHLFSSTVYLNYTVFFIVYPFLHLSVYASFLTSFYFPSAPFTIWTYPCSPCPPQSSLQPRAPSPTSPDDFPMNVKQAYKAFAAVPRSLAVLEPPQVGCATRTLHGCQRQKHAVVIGSSHPAPSWQEPSAL